jgi:hypothetical protein
MKQKIAFMIGACSMALAAMTSCSSDDMLNETTNNPSEALNVIGSVEGLTTSRATDALWEAGDSIGLISTGIASNAKYVTTNGDGVFSAADDGVFLNDRSSHVFYAYYPYSKNVSSNNLTFNVCDSANVVAQKRNDIMVANGTASASYPTLQLQFKHAMARVIINVKTSTDDGFEADDVFDSNCCAMISSVYTSCSLDVTSSTVKACGTLSDLYLVAPTDNHENHVRQYVVYIAPQAGRKFNIIFYRGSSKEQVYSVQLTSGSWVAGKSYTYNITVKREVLDLSSAATISDWTVSTTDLDAGLKN